MTEKNDLLIRLATPEDSEGVLRIYEPFVADSAVTFTSSIPTAAEIAQQIRSTEAQFPYLVCTKGDEVIGYAYANTVRPREAYRWNAELSIYLDDRFHRLGIATALYTALLQILRSQGYVNLYAVITLPNDPSIALHRHFGFKEIGVHEKTGYKLGEWRDVVWMHYRIEGAADPQTHGLPTPLAELRKNEIETALGMATALLRGV